MRPDSAYDGAFIRVRTLGCAVEYAGIRVRDGTTAAEAVELVANRLRLDAGERAGRRLVCARAARADS